MRFRPVDKPFVVGDNSQLRALGWAPQVALDQSLARILEYWRGQG
jgi:nucleoside-diphosphate-sugar epimerase